MTAIIRGTGGQIPPGIDTVEGILAWAALSLHNLQKGAKYKEAESTGLGDAGTAPLIDTSVISAADGTYRLLVRTAIELDPAYITDAGKLWSFAREFGNVALPTAYTTD